MRFVVILGANRIHVASSTDATGYYAGIGRKLNIVRAPLRVPGPSPRKIADKLGKNRIVSAGTVGGHPPVLPFLHRFFGDECTKLEREHNYARANFSFSSLFQCDIYLFFFKVKE